MTIRATIQHTVVVLACTLAVIPVSGQTQAPLQVQPAPPGTGAPAPAVDLAGRITYVLGVDDQVTIHVQDAPDVGGDKPIRVDQNGDIRLPMLGRVRAAGLSAAQLEADLVARLKTYLEEPDVTVTVAEVHGQSVSVIGAVSSSGVRPLVGHPTLVEVLSMSGGLTSEAGPMVRVTRRIDVGPLPLPGAAPDSTGQFMTAEVPLKPLLESQIPLQNIVIQPFDVVSVAKAESVYVVGEVAKPGIVLLSKGSSISVLEAVSASGGVLKTAAPEGLTIVHRPSAAEPRNEIRINLTRIMSGKADDPSLSPGDILVVPDSKKKRVTVRLAESLLQMGTLIGTYSILR